MSRCALDTKAAGSCFGAFLRTSLHAHPVTLLSPVVFNSSRVDHCLVVDKGRASQSAELVSHRGSLSLPRLPQVCDLKAGEFIHTIGDAHVYLNHVEALREQLRRKPRPFPSLSITPGKKSIDSFVYEDFELKGYSPHKSIKMKMAV